MDIKKKIVFLHTVAMTVITVLLLWDYHCKHKRIKKRKRVHESSLSGHEFTQYLISSNPRNSYDLLRMRTDVFLELCDLLKRERLLRATKRVSVEEQVAIFLATVGHSQRNRVMQIQFQHSGQTISKYFNVVLDTLLYIYPDYVKLPGPGMSTPAQIALNPVFYPFFKVHK